MIALLKYTRPCRAGLSFDVGAITYLQGKTYL